jgi:Fic family protein
METRFSRHFDYLQRPWWWLAYRTDTVSSMISEVIRDASCVQQNLLSKETHSLTEGYSELHKRLYIRECICSESDVDLSLEDIDTHLSSTTASKMSKKVRNLKAAMDHLFPSHSRDSLYNEQFTPRLALSVHAMVGDGIIPNSGTYRQTGAMAVQENYVYCHPEMIPRRMDTLFEQVHVAVVNNTRLSDIIKIAASFLSSFLWIHPFTNGNGRVARLLTSVILLQNTLLPVSIYSCRQAREVYLDCLRESRSEEPFKPEALGTLILESVLRSQDMLIHITDMDRTLSEGFQ